MKPRHKKKCDQACSLYPKLSSEEFSQTPKFWTTCVPGKIPDKSIKQLRWIGVESIYDEDTGETQVRFRHDIDYFITLVNVIDFTGAMIFVYVGFLFYMYKSSN